jgi:putative PIN family toxin of toxin-antitoxin system
VKIVLDTNVLLSAAFFPGVCDKLLAACLIAPAVELVLSEHILREFVEHGTGKLKAPIDRIEAFVAELRSHCTIIQPAPIPAEDFEDPDDLPILGTAVAGNADGIVTGDKALLALGTYRGVMLLSPRAFYRRIRD